MSIIDNDINRDQLPEWPDSGNFDPVHLPDGRVLTEYDTLFIAEVVLGYDRQDLSAWFIDIYVPCDGSCSADPKGSECARNRHRVGHQYVLHSDLLAMFSEAYGTGLREGKGDGIAWMFPDNFKPVADEVPKAGE